MPSESEEPEKSSLAKPKLKEKFSPKWLITLRPILLFVSSDNEYLVLPVSGSI